MWEHENCPVRLQLLKIQKREKENGPKIQLNLAIIWQALQC